MKKIAKSLAVNFDQYPQPSSFSSNLNPYRLIITNHITLHPLYFVRSGVVATAMFLNSANSLMRIFSNKTSSVDRSYRLQLNQDGISIDMNDFRFQASSLRYFCSPQREWPLGLLGLTAEGITDNIPYSK